MKLLQLNTLTKEFVDDLKPSFDNLPETTHKDGKYRLRRYSAVELRTTFWSAGTQIEIYRQPHRDFEQSEEFNKFQGGMVRDFEEIKEEALQSDCMKEACLIFKRANDLPDGQEVEIHQMRVLTQENGLAEASPEGVHQDGYDHVAVIGINRHNIYGGELLAYGVGPKGVGHAQVPFFTYALSDGEMMMLNDKKLWHNANPVVAGEELNTGHGDWFVFCANK